MRNTLNRPYKEKPDPSALATTLAFPGGQVVGAAPEAGEDETHAVPSPRVVVAGLAGRVVGPP